MLLTINRAALNGTGANTLNVGTGDITINPAEIIAFDGVDTFFIENTEFKTLIERDSVEIEITTASTTTGAELFINSIVSSSGFNNYFTETGTATGNQISFQGGTTVGTTNNVIARLPYDQVNNTTIIEQVDAMVAEINKISQDSSNPTVFAAGTNIMYRNCTASRVGNTLVLTKNNLLIVPNTITAGDGILNTLTNGKVSSVIDEVNQVWNASVAGQPGRLVYNYTIGADGALDGTVY